MASRKNLTRFFGFLILCGGVLGLHMEVQSVTEMPVADEHVRADLITIDAIACEAAPVDYLHTQHTEALAKHDMDCSACHLTAENGKMSMKYMRFEDGDYSDMKNIYHSNCIGCHTGVADDWEETGPKSGECRGCHNTKSEYVAYNAPAEMKNVLHYRHWGSDAIPKDKGQDTNCGACHHQYDEKTEKLVYVKYEEEGCRSCHTDEPEDEKMLSRVEASHAQCVGCHWDSKKAGAEKFGPVTCVQCHGKAEHEKIEADNAEFLKKIGGALPRLPRKQPDANLLHIPLAEGQKAEDVTQSAPPVAFNHKVHEGGVETCRSCHHKTLKACGDCHTLEGKEEGGFVKLTQAMHSKDSIHSCVGCHNEITSTRPECAGCHNIMTTRTSPGAAERACTTCHAPIEGWEQVVGADKEAKEAYAQGIVDARRDEPLMVETDKIPDIVKIDAVGDAYGDKYEPAELPHRKIILSMAKGIEGNSLSTNFHAVPAATCTSCHHQAPATEKPASCKSCHGKPFQDVDPGRPGLKAAYHDQCMRCHKAMKLEKPVHTTCDEGCHKKKS